MPAGQAADAPDGHRGAVPAAKPVEGHEVCQYLLRGLKAECPMRVLSTDITYVPTANGVPVPVRRAVSVQPLRHRMAAFRHTDVGLLHGGGGGNAEACGCPNF